MNESLKLFTQELLKDLEANLSRKEVGDVLERTKADGEVTVRFVISTPDTDRQGDSLDQRKWDFTKFNMNPVVLFGHDYKSLPIGRGSTPQVGGDGKTYMDVTFTPEAINPFGAQIGRMAQGKWINTVSVGYIEREDGTMELLEVSVVPVPANPYALAQRDIQSMRLDLNALAMKGIAFSIKANEEGTPVTVPANKNNNMNDKLKEALAAEHDRHQKDVAAAIDELSAPEGEEKAVKSIDDFEKAMDDEHKAHAEACMKAIDENWELDEQKAEESQKAIDEFKSAIGDECKAHVEACDKAIETFKTNEEDTEKAIEAFKGEMDSEMSRHKDTHMKTLKEAFGEGEDDEPSADEGKDAPEGAKKSACDACGAEGTPEQEGQAHEDCPKAEGNTPTFKGLVEDNVEAGAAWREKNERISYVMTIMYAFADAYYMSDNEAFYELLDEAIGLLQAYSAEEKSEGPEDEEAEKAMKEKIAGLVKKTFEAGNLKYGRSISKKTKEKLEATVKAIEDLHGEHGKSTDAITAALKELIGSEEPGGGEEKPDPEEGGEKSQPAARGVSPNQRPRPSERVAGKKGSDDFEVFMQTRELLKAVHVASREGLSKINDIFREKYPDRK